MDDTWPYPMPEAAPHPLRGDSFQDQYVRAMFLSSLSMDYASTARKLVGEIRARDDPYTGGDGEALLVVIAVRDVVRISIAVQRTPLLPGLFKDAIKQQVAEMNRAHPHLGAARDIIEHVDDYMRSKGKRSDHWFDLTKRFDADRFVLRIGGNLNLDMVGLVNDASELANVVNQTIEAWFNIERMMKPLDDVAKMFMSLGISVKVERQGDTAVVTILNESQDAPSEENEV